MHSANQGTILIGSNMVVGVLDVEAGGYKQQGGIEPSKLEALMSFGGGRQTAVHGTIAGELQTFMLLRVEQFLSALGMKVAGSAREVAPVPTLPGADNRGICQKLRLNPNRA